jgi:AmiR/NasT family two-component response regulator
MQYTLLVSSTEKSRTQLMDLICSMDPQEVLCTQNGGEARRLLPEHDFALIVINTPLSDEFGIELSITAADRSLAGVLLLVGAENADAVAAKVEDSGVVVVSKPINRPYFHQAYKLVVASHRRAMNLQQENDKLQFQIEEIRIINRAKSALMEKLGMSEPQAHHFIEKQAMDSRTTRGQIARGIHKEFNLNTEEP